MSSDHGEVRTLLDVLTTKVANCREGLKAQHVGNALYGLQGMSTEYDEVQLVFSALKIQLTHCFDKSITDHSDFDVVDLLRSTVLFRHHIVTILGSESLCSEYHRKLDDEFISRRQRGDSFFTTSAFQSSYEKKVYNRVVALASELQITDLRHNVYLLNCFECDITFTVCDDEGTSVVVNIRVDGIFHEKKRKQSFCRLRDKELMSRGIHVVRITTNDAVEIDAILRKTVDQVREGREG